MRERIDFGHAPFVELDAEIRFDPRKRVLLADRQNDVVAGKESFAYDAFGKYFYAVHGVFHLLEHHADELTVLDDERFGRMIDDDRDVLFFGVVELPFRRLEKAARFARHHFHVFAAEPQRGAAAIHGGVADADDEHVLTDGIDVPECDRLQPIDADVNAVGVVAAGQMQIFAFGSAAADEYRIEEFAVEQRFQAVHRRIELEIHATIDDVANFFFEHRRRQAE